MVNFFSSVVVQVSNLVAKVQVKRFLSAILVSFLLLTSLVDPTISDQSISKRLEQKLDQEDSTRPKTTGEWKQQARETQDAPGERLKRIGQQSAEAIKDFGSVYPDTAERSADELQNKGTNR
jgi:hypothetical protein